jgi:hypothetical protein
MSKKQSKSKNTSKSKTSKVQIYGPLGPWRLSIAVLVAAIVSGMALYHAALSGVGVDMALGRSFGVAFVTWIVLGSINKMLGVAEALGPVTDESLAADQEPSTR